MLTRRGSETGAREQDAAAKATEVAARVGNTVLEQSFLSGLDDLFEALKNPEQSAANFAGRFAQSMTPFAGLQRSITQAIDPTVRRAKTAEDVFKANIPGLSSSVPPRIDRFGEAVTREGGPIKRAADPFNTSTITSDPVGDELQRLNGAGYRVPLSLPSGDVRLRGEKVDLSPQHTTQNQQQKGRAVHLLLSRIIADPRYADMDDERRAYVLERAISRMRLEVSRRQREQAARGIREARRQAPGVPEVVQQR
jgi:hypothetical protein